MDKSRAPGDPVITDRQMERLLEMIGELQAKTSTVEARLSQLGAAIRRRADAQSRNRAAGTRRRYGDCLDAVPGRQGGQWQQARWNAGRCR